MSDVADDRPAITSARFASTTSQMVEWTVASIVFVIAVLILDDAFDSATRIWIVTSSVAGLAAWIVVQDMTTFTVADGAVVSISCLALADRWASGDSLAACGLDVLLTGGLLLAFREIYYRRKGFDGLGLGDVKLAAAGGLLVGATAFAWVLLAASLLALGIAASRSFGSANRLGFQLSATDRLAFGAVLAPTIWGAWVAQHASLLAPVIGS